MAKKTTPKVKKKGTGGRPRKAEKDLRTTRFGINVSLEEDRFLREGAAKARVEEPFVWGRETLIEAAEKLLGRQLPLPKRPEKPARPARAAKKPESEK